MDFLFGSNKVLDTVLSTVKTISKFEDVAPSTAATTSASVKVQNTSYTPVTVTYVSDKIKVAGYVTLAISILIGLFAAYLSWTCYENVRYSSIPARILFAVFAYIFGTLYLIIYALFKSSSCSSRHHHTSSRR